MASQAGVTPEQQYEIKGIDAAFQAGEALTGHQFKALYLSSEGNVKKMTQSANTEHFIGFCQSGDVDSSVTVALGAHVSVRISGITRAVAGAAITVGDFVMNGDAYGRVITATDNNQVIGIALEAASAINHIITVLIIRCPIKGDNT